MASPVESKIERLKHQLWPFTFFELISAVLGLTEVSAGVSDNAVNTF
jgi:hypothetical protein